MITRWWREAKTWAERVEMAILSCIVGAMLFMFAFVIGLLLRGVGH